MARNRIAKKSKALALYEDVSKYKHEEARQAAQRWLNMVPNTRDQFAHRKVVECVHCSPLGWAFDIGNDHPQVFPTRIGGYDFDEKTLGDLRSVMTKMEFIICNGGLVFSPSKPFHYTQLELHKTAP